jgi:hypothetical protein
MEHVIFSLVTFGCFWKGDFFMYDEIRSLANTKKTIKFVMHGEEASFQLNEDGDWIFTIGEDDIICYAPDIDSAIECLMDECGEDELEVLGMVSV